MAEVPVTLRSSASGSPSVLADTLGQAVAGILEYMISVADREDRLESGTGHWKESIDEQEVRQATRLSVLRALSTGCALPNFEVLEALVAGSSSFEELANETAYERLALSERVSDLVSCGLVSKLPERGSVVVSPSGAELVRVVQHATDAAISTLGKRS